MQFEDTQSSDVFVIQPPRSPDFNFFDFFLWSHVKSVYSASIENKETFKQRFFLPCTLFAASPERFKNVR